MVFVLVALMHVVLVSMVFVRVTLVHYVYQFLILHVTLKQLPCGKIKVFLATDCHTEMSA